MRTYCNFASLCDFLSSIIYFFFAFDFFYVGRIMNIHFKSWKQKINSKFTVKIQLTV